MSCKKLLALITCCLIVAGGSTPVRAQPPSAGGVPPGKSTTSSMAVETPVDQVVNAATWEQKMDAQVPLSLEFRDENGKTVRLGEYFGKKPVILTLIFYNCTMLCTEIMNGTVRAVHDMKFEAGSDYEIVTLSIDHRETPKLAKLKKELYIEEAKRPEAAAGWHFLTGSKENIKQVADAVGFEFEYDPESDSFAHPNGITILTPQGRVSNYMMGIDYPARDMRFNLIKASDNQIGTAIDQFILTCFHYNPANGKYTLSIMRVVRWASIATVLLLAFAVIGAVRAGKKQEHERAAQEKLTGSGQANAGHVA